MTEIVFPGSYVTERPEVLISAGRVATGIVGVIGRAFKGPVGVPVTLSGVADARERFRPPDGFDSPEDRHTPLTMVRALEHAYGNGAASVVADRVTGSSRSGAAFSVQDAEG